MTLVLEDYLARIGLAGPLAPTLESLTAVHRAHVGTFPFENLEVFLSGIIGLDPDALGRKLVAGRRGGWCFELNGLLHWALVQLGFDVRPLMARNTRAENRARTHQVLLVTIDGQGYLADTGFGGSVIRRPFLWEADRREDHEGQTFRLVCHPGAAEGSAWAEPARWELQSLVEGVFKPLYDLTLEPFTSQDFLTANHYHLSSPLSSFPQHRLVNRVIPGGRLSLVDRSFRRYRFEGGEEVLDEEKLITEPAVLRELLSREFLLDLSVSEAETIFHLKAPPKLVETARHFR